MFQLLLYSHNLKEDLKELLNKINTDQECLFRVKITI